MGEIWHKTGSGAMAEEFSQDKPWVIRQVTLKLSSVGGASENFAGTLDAEQGTDFDAELESQDMAAVANLNFTSLPWYGKPGDAVDFTYTNTNGRVWGLRVVWEPWK